MARPKTKEWKQKSFSMDIEAISKLKHISKFENMSESDMVDFLVQNWSAGINPAEKLQLLNQDRNKLKAQMNIIDEKIEQTTSQLKQYEDWRKLKATKKNQAIRILSRKILHKEYQGAEIASQNWQRMTGIPATELLMEAKTYIQRSGI